MIGPDIIFRHVLAFLVPCGFAFIVFLASRAAQFFWARVTGVVLALLTFYFSMMIMNRLLFSQSRIDEADEEAGLREPPEGDGG